MPDLTDPTRATSLSLGRKTFVGLSATAATFGSAIAAALAQGTDFGKPHPPIVPEDDPTIGTARPSITYGTRTIDAYYAAPKNARPSAPAVVVVQAIWGLDAQLRDVVRRFAKEGFIAIAPDLYTGLGAPSGDGATDFAPFRDVAAKLSDDVVDADLAATADFVRAGAPNGRREKIGVVGFCMGGGITLRQAVDNAATFAAASVFYGKVRYGTTDNKGTITPIALDYASSIGTPIAGSWGERDTSILPADVRALDAKLTGLAKPHEFRIYEGAGHAFFDDTRESYAPSAAADAWARTLAWFGEYLK
jgi:carboxymethylenebutenolidase